MEVRNPGYAFEPSSHMSKDIEIIYIFKVLKEPSTLLIEKLVIEGMRGDKRPRKSDLMKLNIMQSHTRNIKMHKNFQSVLYVDDLCIFFSSSPDGNLTHLQDEIDRLDVLAINRGFSSSPTKTSCTHFCRLRKDHPQVTLNLQGQVIENRTSVKFLGIVFDHKLYWKDHIEYLAIRCRKYINLIMCKGSIRCGADREVLIRLYKTLVEFRIDYGRVVYNSARTSKIKLLGRIQLAALRTATGAYRTMILFNYSSHSYFCFLKFLLVGPVILEAAPVLRTLVKPSKMYPGFAAIN
nr:unnamed protein product [Callosobruchus chinensis]